MIKQEFLNHLARLGACSDALDCVRSHPSDDARAIWESCDRLDWLLWLGFEVGLRAEVRGLAFDYAERALPIWESWAGEHAPAHFDAPRAALDAARQGAASCAARAYDAAAYDAAAARAYDAASYAAVAARTASYAAVAARVASYAAVAVAYAATAAASSTTCAANADAERAWQFAHTRSILTWDRIEQAMVTL